MQTRGGIVALSLVWLGCGSGAVTFERAGRCEPALSVNGTRCPSFAACTAKVGDVVTLASTEGCEAISILATGCTEPLACTLSRAETVKVSGRVRLVALSIALPANEGEVAYAGPGVQGACSSDCSVAFEYADQVTLTAKAGAGFRFAGFTGEACGANATCQLTLDQPRSVSATFTRVETRRLTVSTTPAGTVRSTPAAIDCRADGGTCAADFPKGSQVTLTAEPAPAAVFTGWTGTVCNGPSCAVTLDTDVTVGASFKQQLAFQVLPSQPTDGGVLVNGVRQSLPFTTSLAEGTTVELEAMLPDDETTTGWANLGCTQSNPLGRCTTVVTAPVAATLRVHPFIERMVGGWTGGIEHRSSVATDAGTIALLGSFQTVTNVFEPPFDPGAIAHDVLLEITLDGGVPRKARSTGAGHARLVTQSTRGLVAAGFENGNGSTVQWGSVSAALDAGQLHAVLFDQNLDPMSVVATPVRGNWSSLHTLEAIGDDVVLIRPHAEVTLHRFSSDFARTETTVLRSAVSALARPVGATVNYFPSSDPGTVADTCGLALQSTESGLATIDGSGQCSNPVRLPWAANLSRRHLLGGRWSSAYLSQVGTTNGQPRLRFDAFDASNQTRWQSPLLVGTNSDFELPTWRPLGTSIYGAIHVTSSGPSSPSFDDGATTRCPADGVLLLRLDAQSGKPSWMHCLPRRFGGFVVSASNVLVLNDRVVLVLQSDAPTEVDYRFGSKSHRVPARSPFLMLLQPPPP